MVRNQAEAFAGGVPLKSRPLLNSMKAAFFAEKWA